jgi:hypothetical protein
MITLSNWQTELPRIIHPEPKPRGRNTLDPTAPYPVRHLKKRKEWKNGLSLSDETS